MHCEHARRGAAKLRPGEVRREVAQVNSKPGWSWLQVGVPLLSHSVM